MSSFNAQNIDFLSQPLNDSRNYIKGSKVHRYWFVTFVGILILFCKTWQGLLEQEEAKCKAILSYWGIDAIHPHFAREKMSLRRK